MDQFYLILISGIFIGAIAGYLGSLMIIKRMGLVGDAFAHLAFPGVAIGLFYNFNIFWGALITVIIGAFLIWFLETKIKAPTEALTGLTFTASVAISLLFLPFSHEEIEEAFTGDVTKITFPDTVLAVVLSIFIFLIIRKIYSILILAEVSEDLAKIEGFNIKKYNLIYLACVALIVALEVKIVGGLLPVALIIIPALTARNLGKNLFQYSFGALTIGVVAIILGILLYKFSGYPAGLLIILTNTLIFLFSLIIKIAFKNY